MKRILLLSRNLNTYISAPKCNYNLALSLAKLGVEVHILSSNIDDTLATNLKKAGIKIHKAPQIFAKRELSLPTYTLKYRNIHPRLGNGYTLFDDITWLHFLRRAMIKTMGSLLTKTQISNLLRESIFEEMILKSSRCIWAVSNMMAKLLQTLYSYPKRKIFVIYNGVDVNYYSLMPNKKRDELREEIGISDKLVILFVGADPIRKGFLPLIKAVNNSPYKRHIIVFAIGFKPDSLLSYLKRYDLDNVNFLGKVSSDKLRRYYQISDVFALPSYFDPFPLAALEAMACGSVPIVSKYTGVAEVLNHGVNGYIIDPLHDGSIASVLDDIVTNSAKLSLIRQEVIKTAKNLSWDNVAKLLMEKM